MSEKNKTSRPTFSSPLYAALRQGSKELGQALKAFPDSMHPVEEPGTLGNPTPQMITAEMGTMQSFDNRLDAYASRGVERDDREQGMDR